MRPLPLDWIASSKRQTSKCVFFNPAPFAEWLITEYYGCFAVPASASRDARGIGNPSPSNSLLGYDARCLNEAVCQFRAYASSTSLSVSRLSAGDVSNGAPDARQFKKCSIGPSSKRNVST